MDKWLLWSILAVSCISTGVCQETKYESIDPMYQITDVNSLIQIQDPNDILRKRNELIAFIWGSRGFPADTLPDRIDPKIEDNHYKELYKTSLARIDQITINMENGLSSIVYHFIPRKSNGKLMIYHEGHSGHFLNGIETIRFFLNHHHAVLAFDMPLKGINRKPIVHFERLGTIKLYKHNQMNLLENPYRYFIDPIVIALNYIKKFQYSEINMTGLSGGGWTTTLYAALDLRIKHSFPVAGSLPLFLRSLDDLGDWEQTNPDLYRIANYPELYIAGAYGEGRSQIQILNQYDPCSFYGIRYQLYEHIVLDRVKSLGKGKFSIFLDTSHREHKISESALQVILREIE